MIKNLKINKNTNNINGVFAVDEFKFFYKVLTIEEYDRELNGYNQLKKYYPVSRLVYNHKISSKNGILIFEYENSVDSKSGLLVSLFFNNHSFNKDKLLFSKILSIYKNVFIKTISKTQETSSDVFFSNRIKTRINKFYSKDFLDTYLNKKIKLNNFEIFLNTEGVIMSVKKYFKIKKNKWSVVSQCDPNDLNIGTKPVLFDYLAGGKNPLMAEFAVFFWYNLAQGSYLSTKYNYSLKEYIKNRDKLDNVSLINNTIRHKISKKRKEFILSYIDEVILPVIKNIGIYEDWYNDFKNYFAMKVLAVFDVSKMSKKDVLLSLGYLELFYNNLDIKSLKDLKEVVKKL
jgi:hypothetical protein